MNDGGSRANSAPTDWYAVGRRMRRTECVEAQALRGVDSQITVATDIAIRLHSR